MQSYLNNPQLKKDFVAEIKKHQEADQILKGTYGNGTGKNWKGCAVGCSIKSLNNINHKEYSTNNHAIYESELGIPEWLARLEDTIFEGLPKDQAMKWPLRFSEAVPIGANLEPIKWKFCVFVLSKNIERVLTLDITENLKEQVVSAVRGVLMLHENAIQTGKWDESARSAAWSAARSAAWSAAESAARSAAWSAAESAARSAAWSAARSAAWSAAWSAARSAAWSAAWSAAESAAESEYDKFANKLIELLEESGKPSEDKE